MQLFFVVCRCFTYTIQQKFVTFRLVFKNSRYQTWIHSRKTVIASFFFFFLCFCWQSNFVTCCMSIFIYIFSVYIYYDELKTRNLSFDSSTYCLTQIIYQDEQHANYCNNICRRYIYIYVSRREKLCQITCALDEPIKRRKKNTSNKKPVGLT